MGESLSLIAELLGWLLIHSLWQGAGLWLLSRLIVARFGDARTRHNVRVYLLLALIAVQAITFVVLCRAAPSSQDVESVELIKPGIMRMPAYGLPWGVQAAGAIAPWLPVLVGAWSGWLALRLVREFFSIITLRRVMGRLEILPPQWGSRFESFGLQLQVQRAVRFLSCPYVSVPATFGWLRPVVLVPSAALLNISPVHLEAAILHELAHVRRGDFLVGLGQLLLESVYWFNPFVRGMIAQMRQDAEACCDSVASEALGSPVTYAKALLAFAEVDDRIRNRKIVVSLTGSGALSLQSRVMWLVADRTSLHRRRASWPALVAGGVALLCMLFVCAGSASAASARLAEDQRIRTESFTQAVMEILELDRLNDDAPAALRQLMAAYRSDSFHVDDPPVAAAIDTLARGADVRVFYQTCITLMATIDTRTWSSQYGTELQTYDLSNEMLKQAELLSDLNRRQTIVRAALVAQALHSCRTGPTMFERSLMETRKLDALRATPQLRTRLMHAIGYQNENLGKAGPAMVKLQEFKPITAAEAKLVVNAIRQNIVFQKRIADSANDMRAVGDPSKALLDAIGTFPEADAWQWDYLRQRLQRGANRK